MNKKNKSLDIIKQIPNVTKYEDNKLTKKVSWFNKNIAFLLLILFILLGVIIILAVAV